MGDNQGPPQWEGDLPPNCPVQPVGKIGVKCVFLDALGQLTIAGPRELGRNFISDYFAGDALYLKTYFPRFNKDHQVNGFAADAVCDGIQAACAKCGIWEDMERVRGRGAWVGDDGGLVLHVGNALVTGEKIHTPGLFGRAVYPSGAPILKPMEAGAKLPPAHAPEAAAWTVMAILKCWAWRRGALDARLFLGAMVASFLGGALKWRPSGWVTGESGCGKSTLQRLRREIMGGWSLNASDASAAGVYQRVKFDAIGVSLDEQESEEDNRKLDAMVKLARAASSGDLVLRGSSVHEGVAFSARNCFLFSSINSAPLRGQDMSRMAQFDLWPIPPGQAEPQWTQTQAQAWGREILRRCLDHWARWPATLEAYREELKRLGHDSRGQDQFGTLLAAADLVLSERGFLADDGPNEDPDARMWDELVAARMPEYSDRPKNWMACIEHLVSSRPHDWKVGGPGSIGGLCARYLEDLETGKRAQDGGTTIKEANALLALAGCALVMARDGPFAGRPCLFLPNSHRALGALYAGTRWPGVPDAPGGWIKALRKGSPDVIDNTEDRYRVDGRQYRGVLLQLNQIVSWRDAPEDETAHKTA